MDAAMLYPPDVQDLGSMTADGQLVDADEFRRLLVSHRRLIRADRRDQRLRGLQDLDTGELFLIDELRLQQSLT